MANGIAVIIANRVQALGILDLRKLTGTTRPKTTDAKPYFNHFATSAAA